MTNENNYLKQVQEIINNMPDAEFMEIVESELDDKQIYIIPANNKPVKIVYEDLPCPVDQNEHCKNAEMVLEDNNLVIKCNNNNNLKDNCMLNR